MKRLAGDLLALGVVVFTIMDAYKTGRRHGQREALAAVRLAFETELARRPEKQQK